MNLENLIRENIKTLSPYSSARDEFEDFTEKMIYLDANENPFSNGINRYPDPQQKELKLINLLHLNIFQLKICFVIKKE